MRRAESSRVTAMEMVMVVRGGLAGLRAGNRISTTFLKLIAAL
jgi:hypothetical protein